MKWLTELLGEGDAVSSKRLTSMLAVLIIVEITQVWLFSGRDFDTTQILFIFGFWACVAGYAQYLTVLKKSININVEKSKKSKDEILEGD
jgi:hypothetical protein